MAQQQQLTDPVCGMKISSDSEFKAGYQGKTFYFCGDEDRKTFQERPSVYARRMEKGMSGIAPEKNDPNA